MPSERFNVTATTTDAMSGRRNRNLARDSVVRVYASGSDETPRLGLEIGGQQFGADLLPNSKATGPVIPDDLVVSGEGLAGDAVVLPVTALGAAQTLRLLVDIEEVG